jgi:hypothetical protein
LGIARQDHALLSTLCRKVARPPMIGRLDEILKRLFAFFVAPLLNVIIISLILNLCLADNYSISALVSQLDVGGISKYITELLTALFSGNFDSLRDYLTRFSSQIAAVSTIVGILLILTIVLVMFLLDRAIYSISWLLPQDFEFDLKAYAAAHHADERIRRLYGLLGRAFDFRTAYGVLTSFLGEQSVDQERVVRRNELAKARSTSRIAFDYAVSYCCLLAAAWLFSIVQGGYFKVWPLTIALVVALLAALGYLIWYANACRDLVEFDIDSFIRLRLYSKQDDRFLSLPEPHADLAVALADPAAARGLRGMLYLRHTPAGIMYEAYLIARRLLRPVLRRK